jgi:hypothetical protein
LVGVTGLKCPVFGVRESRGGEESGGRGWILLGFLSSKAFGSLFAYVEMGLMMKVPTSTLVGVPQHQPWSGFQLHEYAYDASILFVCFRLSGLPLCGFLGERPTGSRA